MQPQPGRLINSYARDSTRWPVRIGLPRADERPSLYARSDPIHGYVAMLGGLFRP